MAWTSSAYPRDYSAVRQKLAEGRNSLIKVLDHLNIDAFAILRTCAGLHLAALSVSVLVSSAQPPILLVITGLALTVVGLCQGDLRPTARRSCELEQSAEHFTEFDAAVAFNLFHERQSQHLVEIADAATRAQRMAEQRSQTWVDLMARVSHELRTPLNAVIGFSDIMNSELLGPLGHERYREYSRHIRDSGYELLKSTEDTLALTGLLAQPCEVSAPIALQLDLLIADAWSFIHHGVAGRDITLEINVSEGVEIYGERRPMRQVFINLISEAIHRANSGSVIMVTSMVNGDFIDLKITVAAGRSFHTYREPSLSICTARALLELQGSGLRETALSDGTWHAATVLPHAAQQDFFTTSLGDLVATRLN